MPRDLLKRGKISPTCLTDDGELGSLHWLMRYKLMNVNKTPALVQNPLAPLQRSLSKPS